MMYQHGEEEREDNISGSVSGGDVLNEEEEGTEVPDTGEEGDEERDF